MRMFHVIGTWGGDCDCAVLGMGEGEGSMSGDMECCLLT